MKKVFIPLSAIMIIVGSCKKGTNAVNNNCDNGYTEFKMDGTDVKICANDYAGATAIITNISSNQIQDMDISINNINGISNETSLFSIDLNSPLGSGAFVVGQDYSALETQTFPQFYINNDFSAEDSLQRVYLSCPNQDRVGTIRFTQIDTFVGGKVKGTYSFSNLCYEKGDYYGTVVSEGHSVTDGFFETNIIQIKNQ